MNASIADAGMCTVDGGALAYEVRGEGPPLVLLHGFSFDMRAWDGQVERPPDAAAHAAAHGVESAKRFWLEHALFTSLRRHPAALTRLTMMVADYSGWHWQHPNPVRTTKTADRLNECKVSTLVLSGDLDVGGYRDIAMKLGTGIAGAKHVRFAHAGHVLNDETDPDFTTAVLDFARDTQ